MFPQGPGYLTGLVVILYLLWSLTALGILYDGSAWGWLGEVARYLLFFPHTANEGPVRIQYKCLVYFHVFPEMKLLFSK
jgi:hypothetical protein